MWEKKKLMFKKSQNAYHVLVFKGLKVKWKELWAGTWKTISLTVLKVLNFCGASSVQSTWVCKGICPEAICWVLKLVSSNLVQIVYSFICSIEYEYFSTVYWLSLTEYLHRYICGYWYIILNNTFTKKKKKSERG